MRIDGCRIDTHGDGGLQRVGQMIIDVGSARAKELGHVLYDGRQPLLGGLAQSLAAGDAGTNHAGVRGHGRYVVERRRPFERRAHERVTKVPCQRTGAVGEQEPQTQVARGGDLLVTILLEDIDHGLDDGADGLCRVGSEVRQGACTTLYVPQEAATTAHRFGRARAHRAPCWVCWHSVTEPVH